MDATKVLERSGSVLVPQLIARSDCEAVVGSIRRLHPAGVPGGRLMDGWRHSEAIRALASHPAVLELLHELYGRRPLPFQTLDFDRGTEQPLHADSIHFDSVPHGLMCGVWIALEDVGPTQGPLRYVPGSHRSAPVRPSDAIGADGRFDHRRYEELAQESVAGMEVQELHATCGDAFVWHADLLHGGAPVLDPGSSRWSQVTHYFFEGGTYITPLLSDFATGELYVREPLVDISRGRRVVHTVDGSPARLVHLRNGRTRVLQPGDTAPGRVTRALSAARSLSRSAKWWAAPLAARADRVRGREMTAGR